MIKVKLFFKLLSFAVPSNFARSHNQKPLGLMRHPGQSYFYLHLILNKQQYQKISGLCLNIKKDYICDSAEGQTNIPNQNHPDSECPLVPSDL